MIKKAYLLLLLPALSGLLWYLSPSLALDARIVLLLGANLAVLWSSQAVPLALSSLLPFIILPLAGIVEPGEILKWLFHPIILLLCGGFILSIALEKTGVHRRIAIALISSLKTKTESRTLLAFMLCSGLCSMWLSNTATTLMLLPIAIAVIEQHPSKKFSHVLLLGIAYAASVGGMGTPIGTPPNLIFMAIYNEAAQTSSFAPITFLGWMLLAVPISLTVLTLCYFVLARNLNAELEFELPKLKPVSKAEKSILLILLCAALAWTLRQNPFGGWSSLLPAWLPAGDGAVAIVAATSVFFVKEDDEQRLLNLDLLKRVPWDLLLLFASGLLFAAGFKASGLSTAVGTALVGYHSLSFPLLLAALCLSVTFLTEILSNTASTALLLPILLAFATSSGIPAIQLLFPATISASCAFMLPVATAPNAVVFGSKRLPMAQMLQLGFVLNIVVAAVIWAYALLLL